MAKGYSARKGFSGGAGMMQQQAQMQQKLLKMARSQPRVLMITNDPERPKVMIKVVTKQ